jgi:hypothetical protein
LSIANADDAVVHEQVVSYQAFPADVELAPSYAPLLAWSRDSTSLYAIVLREDLFTQGADSNVAFPIWLALVDGQPAQEMKQLTAVPHSFRISPNQVYMAYLRGPRPGSNDRELHLALVDGSQDLVYARGDALEFWGWAPGGTHFIFAESAGSPLLWGDVCGEAQSLFDPPGRPEVEHGIHWVDGEHFLYAANQELRFGKVTDGSILVGPLSGVYQSF